QLAPRRMEGGRTRRRRERPAHRRARPPWNRRGDRGGPPSPSRSGGGPCQRACAWRRPDGDAPSGGSRTGTERTEPMTVKQMRLVVTADDYDAAVAFYRDVLGMPEEAAFSGDGGRVAILQAGRATLEIADPKHADYVDAVEVGSRVAGHIRVAVEVEDAEAATDRAAGERVEVIAPPTLSPCNSLISRPAGPAALVLILSGERGAEAPGGWSRVESAAAVFRRARVVADEESPFDRVWVLFEPPLR